MCNLHDNAFVVDLREPVSSFYFDMPTMYGIMLYSRVTSFQAFLCDVTVVSIGVQVFAVHSSVITWCSRVCDSLMTPLQVNIGWRPTQLLL